MAKRDFYEVLGVSKDADGKTIKSAYRKLAMQYHPDRNPDDKSAEDKFREATEAYDVLKDDQKRAAYDRMGHAAFDQSAGFGGGAGGFGAGFGAGGFSDIFDEMFSDFMGGRGGSRKANTKGADLRYDLDISLEEAFHGDNKTITIPVAIRCETCDGSGAAKGSSPVNCGTCGGHGKVRAQQGFFTVERTCPACQGQGQTISSPCGDCGGQGRVQKNRTLNVNVPAGVDTGTRIRLSGEGEAGLRGGAPGDLYIFINIYRHELFDRDGTNLLLTMPVPMTTAALGGTVDVPNLDGKRARITIQPGTQSGHRLRLKGKGMPGLQGRARGD
ncbi:MAG: molecular chaperone DnaJ, partial [Alphaproteobacteria bacterium]|nr:molecular chaperone DnaJ [Alphaproteobacteria bacterium]